MAPTGWSATCRTEAADRSRTGEELAQLGGDLLVEDRIVGRALRGQRPPPLGGGRLPPALFPPASKDQAAPGAHVDRGALASTQILQVTPADPLSTGAQSLGRHHGESEELAGAHLQLPESSGAVTIRG